MSLEAFRPIIRRLLKSAAEQGPLRQSYLAWQKRRQIASLARKGAFSRPPLTTEETARILLEWEQHGRSIPPPAAYKQDALRAYGRRFGLSLMVETGTYLGDTVAAVRGSFRLIYSIELSEELARLTKRRFQHDAAVTILAGDSEEMLPKILSGVQEPCLFWLDGHYSAGVTAHGKRVTPIIGELTTIFAHPLESHVVLIDDARQFGEDKGYPTLEELRQFVADRRPGLLFEVKDDIIRLSPPLY